MAAIVINLGFYRHLALVAGAAQFVRPVDCVEIPAATNTNRPVRDLLARGGSTT